MIYGLETRTHQFRTWVSFLCFLRQTLSTASRRWRGDSRIARHLNGVSHVRACMRVFKACVCMPWNHRRRCRRPFQTRVCCVSCRLRNFCAGFLRFLQKANGGAEPGLERWSKDELQRGGEEEFVPQSLLHADTTPPLPLKLAPGLEVTNIMDGGGGGAACFLCVGCGQIEHSSNLSAGRRRREMEAAMQRDFTPQKAPRLLFWKIKR